MGAEVVSKYWTKSSIRMKEINGGMTERHIFLIYLVHKKPSTIICGQLNQHRPRKYSIWGIGIKTIDPIFVHSLWIVSALKARVKEAKGWPSADLNMAQGTFWVSDI